MNYKESDQKTMLREMEKELLALLAVDPDSGFFEVIYTNNGYRRFENHYQGSDFFDAWEKTGLPMIDEGDRERMSAELGREAMQRVLRGTSGEILTKCRIRRGGRVFWCRIKMTPNPLGDGTVLVGFRNADREIRQDTRHFISQTHPHFLYNALSSIREIVLEDPKYGADLLYDFTTHLRAGVRAMSSDRKIPVREEIENVKAYVNIEKMRFGERLAVDYDIRADDFSVIPFSIQPIVENAIRHGVFRKGPEGGTVVIRTYEEGDRSVIEVSDDGAGFDPDQVMQEIRDGERDSTGLRSLMLRLENMMHAEVSIRSRQGQGTKVSVRIAKSGC